MSDDVENKLAEAEARVAMSDDARPAAAQPQESLHAVEQLRQFISGQIVQGHIRCCHLLSEGDACGCLLCALDTLAHDVEQVSRLTTRLAALEQSAAKRIAAPPTVNPVCPVCGVVMFQDLRQQPWGWFCINANCQKRFSQDMVRTNP